MQIKCLNCHNEMTVDAYTTKMHEGKSYTTCGTCGKEVYHETAAQPLVVEEYFVQEEEPVVQPAPRARARRTL